MQGQKTNQSDKQELERRVSKLEKEVNKLKEKARSRTDGRLWNVGSEQNWSASPGADTADIDDAHHMTDSDQSDVTSLNDLDTAGPRHTGAQLDREQDCDGTSSGHSPITGRAPGPRHTGAQLEREQDCDGTSSGYGPITDRAPAMVQHPLAVNDKIEVEGVAVALTKEGGHSGITGEVKHGSPKPSLLALYTADSHEAEPSSETAGNDVPSLSAKSAFPPKLVSSLLARHDLQGHSSQDQGQLRYEGQHRLEGQLRQVDGLPPLLEVKPTTHDTSRDDPREAGADIPGGSEGDGTADEVTHNEFVVKRDGTRVGVWTVGRLKAGRTIGPIPKSSDNLGEGQEDTNLMKFIQHSDNTETSNLMAVHLQSQLYLRAIREIQAGEEMLLYAKDKLYQDQDLYNKAAAADDGEPVPCGDCGEIFQNQVALQHHVIHSCNNSRSYDYKHFSQSDDELKSSKGDAQSPDVHHHHEVVPADEGEFKCEECPRSFSLKSNLARHQIVHESGRRFSCEHCERHFTDPSNLQRHIRSQHHGARCHTCTDCGKTFATSSGLKQHQHIHSSVKPFQCEVCLKAYTQFSNLCRHKRMHADCRQQIKCNDCGQAFSTITSLSKHKRFCEGALRNGLRLGGFGADAAKLSSASGLMAGGPAAPFSPAMMMGLYGSRPPYPFYPPSLSSLPMFPAGHPLAALTSLSPSSMQSAGLMGSPEKQASSPKRKFDSINEASDGGSDDLSGSDLDNIPSDSESDRSAKIAEKSSELSSVPVTIAKPVALLPQSSPSPTYNFSPKRMASFSPTLPVAPSREQPESPFDLSKQSKEEQITPKSSPTLKEEAKTPSGEQPLDLSRAKEITPPEAPRKTHIFGEGSKTPVVSETRLHYAYPQFPSHLMMEQALRMSESKERVSEASSFIPYPRFPFSSPPKYPVGVNPFGFVNKESPKAVTTLATLSPQTKSFPDFTGSPTQVGQYSSPNKLKDRYGCKFCGKIFPRSANLTRHLRTHTGEQPYKCKYCERSFSISSNLQRHVRNIHNKEKPFRCPLCDRCFGQQTNLDRHLKKHETEGLNIVDSPENPDERENELEDKDMAYFSEIRNFIGKVPSQTGDSDINQNSVSISDMKRKIDQLEQEKLDDDELDEEIDPVSDDLDEKSELEKMSGEMDAESDEPPVKKANIDNPLDSSEYEQQEAPLPLCQKPGSFKLKRGFSPVMCS